MLAGRTFCDGEESIYVLTHEGCERRAELLACAQEAVSSDGYDGRRQE